MGHFTQKWLILLIYRSFSLWMTKNDYGHRTTGLDDRNETKMRGEGQNEIIAQTAKSLPLSIHFDVIWHMTLRVRNWQSESAWTAFALLALFRQSSSFWDNSRLYFETTVVFIFTQQSSSFLQSCSFLDNSRLHFETTVVFNFTQQSSSFLESSSFLHNSRLHF